MYVKIFLFAFEMWKILASKRFPSNFAFMCSDNKIFFALLLGPETISSDWETILVMIS